jgi:uncharacterized protein YukE
MNNINVDISVLPRVSEDLNNVVGSLHELINVSNNLLNTIKQNWDDAQFQAFETAIKENNKKIVNLCPEISEVARSINEYHTNLHNAINNFYR